MENLMLVTFSYDRVVERLPKEKSFGHRIRYSRGGRYGENHLQGGEIGCILGIRRLVGTSIRTFTEPLEEVIGIHRKEISYESRR